MICRIHYVLYQRGVSGHVSASVNVGFRVGVSACVHEIEQVDSDCDH